MHAPGAATRHLCDFRAIYLLGWEHFLVDLNKRTQYFGAFDCVLFIFLLNFWSYLISVQSLSFVRGIRFGDSSFHARKNSLLIIRIM